MKKFGGNVKHIIDCRELNTEKITKHKAMILSRQYNTVCPRLYPLAAPNLIDYKEKNMHIIEKHLEGLNFTISEPGVRHELYPAKCAGVFEEDMITHETFTNPEEVKLLAEIQEKTTSVFQTNENLKDVDFHTIEPTKVFKNEPEIFFTGTISMKPTGSRCASGIYLNIKGNHPNAEKGSVFSFNFR
jgi:hypothetical protein